MKNLITFAVTT